MNDLSRQAPRTGLSRGIFVVTALGGFMASLDLSIANVTFPALAQSFPDASRSLLTWVITGYAIVFASLLVTAGRIADRFGRRRVFYAGAAVFALGSALTGAATSVTVLIGGRLAQGAGAALLVPASLGLLLAASPPATRSQAVALWSGVAALAVAVGPSLGAVLVSTIGWRSAFYINLPLAAAAGLAGRRYLPADEPSREVGRPDYLGVVLGSVSLAALVLAISEGPQWGWTDPRPAGAALLAAVTGATFIRRCAVHPQPAVDLQLFRARSFSIANTATVAYGMSFLPVLLGSVLFLTGVWHYSILQAGLSLTPAPVVVAALSGPAGRLATRIGFGPVIVTGSIVIAGGLCWFATALDATPRFASGWLPGIIIIGIGIGLTFPVLSAAAVSGVPPARFAVGGAINQTARQVGGALGIAILVAILGNDAHTTLDRFQHLWFYSATLATSVGVIGLMLPRVAPTQAGRPGSVMPRHGVDQLGSRPDPQLAINVPEVVFDRLRAEEERRGGFPGSAPFGDAEGDLQLLGGQIIERGGISAT
jgi:EmrB/QacA subfamily drug resistance transporter